MSSRTTLLLNARDRVGNGDAVVVRVTVGDAEIADQGLREKVVPAASGASLESSTPRRSLSMLLFESAEAAQAVADGFRAGSILPETVTVSRIEVREVVATA